MAQSPSQVHFTNVDLPAVKWDVTQVPANEACVHFLGLPQQTFTNWVIYNDGNIFSHSWGIQRLKPRCLQGCATLKAAGENLFLALLSTSGVTGSLGAPWLVTASPQSLPPSSHGILSAYFHMAMSSLSPLLIRILVILH